MRHMATYRQCFRMLGLLLAVILGSASLALAIEIGEQAPDFTLPSTTGEDVHLSQFQGKQLVLLEFYINDFGGT